MKRVMQSRAGTSAFAVLVAMAMALTGLPAHADGQANGAAAKSGGQKARIGGVWDAKVWVTDCSSGNPVLPPFDALGVFEADGSFHDTNSNNPTLMVRSDAFGYWKHVRGNKFRFAFKLFNFDVAGNYLGYQVVRHDLVLAKDGKSYTSKGGAEFYNPDGTPRVPVTVCSETTATRFK